MFEVHVGHLRVYKAEESDRWMQTKTSVQWTRVWWSKTKILKVFVIDSCSGYPPPLAAIMMLILRDGTLISEELMSNKFKVFDYILDICSH